MITRWVNNLFLIIILLCSTSLYQLSFLGPFQNVAELGGVVIIVVLIILNLVYSEERSIKRNFDLPVALILLSVFTSMLMASFAREQDLGVTMLAQRAMYYYLLYFLLHKFKTDPKDLEKIFIILGLLYVVFYLVQYLLYPRLIFDSYVKENRGTIRIYLTGVDYMVITFFIGLQKFFRSNRIKYLLLVLAAFTIFILTGGRQGLAIMTFMMVMFILIDRKVKRRAFIILLGMVGILAFFVIFQEIFNMLLLQSRQDASMGEDYIRIKAARYFLTTFFNHPLAYITGNGAYDESSNYGREIYYLNTVYHYILGDVGLVGNYVIYGIFFILGVVFVFVRSLRLRIESDYTYTKYVLVAMLLSLITAGGFTQADVICFVVCVMYIMDVSNHAIVKQDYE